MIWRQKRYRKAIAAFALFASVLHAAFAMSQVLMAFGTTPASAVAKAQGIDLGLGIEVAICRGAISQDGDGKVPGNTGRMSCPVCAAHTVATAAGDVDLFRLPVGWPDADGPAVQAVRLVSAEPLHDFLARGPPGAA